MKKPKPSVDSLRTGQVPANFRLEGPLGLAGMQQKSLEQASASVALTKPTRGESLAKIEESLVDATGVGDPKLAHLIVSQMSAIQIGGSAENKIERLTNAMAAVEEMDPKNATEAMLAVQMFGVHNAAVTFLRRATAEGQNLQGTDANVLRATRLMRLFNDQLEAMAKLKGKAGQQKVTVEHVHVHSGGQAIVGSVETQGGSEAERKTFGTTPCNTARIEAERQEK